MDLEALKTEGERLANKLKDTNDPDERKSILDEIRRINDMINEQTRLDHDQQRIDLEEGKIKIEDLENERKAKADNIDRGIDAGKTAVGAGLFVYTLDKVMRFEETGVLTSKVVPVLMNFVKTFIKFGM